jgi:hypothetical protein
MVRGDVEEDARTDYGWDGLRTKSSEACGRLQLSVHPNLAVQLEVLGVMTERVNVGAGVVRRDDQP